MRPQPRQFLLKIARAGFDGRAGLDGCASLGFRLRAGFGSAAFSVYLDIVAKGIVNIVKRQRNLIKYDFAVRQFTAHVAPPETEGVKCLRFVL